MPEVARGGGARGGGRGRGRERGGRGAGGGGGGEEEGEGRSPPLQRMCMIIMLQDYYFTGLVSQPPILYSSTHRTSATRSPLYSDRHCGTHNHCQRW